MTIDNFCFYLQNRLIRTGQTGGQWYSDTSSFSIPWRIYYFMKMHFLILAKNYKNRTVVIERVNES
jgi:hypothetical protein